MTFEIPYLLVAGGAAGFVGGFFGVGGGVILVPSLWFLFNTLGVEQTLCLHLAIGTSLALLLPTSFMATKTQHELVTLKLLFVKQLCKYQGFKPRLCGVFICGEYEDVDADGLIRPSLRAGVSPRF